MTGFPPDAQRRLLDVQAADARLDLLDQRWRSHPSVAALQALDAREAEVAAQAAMHAEAVDQAHAAVRAAEREAEQVLAHQRRDRKRLDAGTVSSPRDLEGLQHEIATLQHRLDGIEDVELEAMERLEEAEQALAACTAEQEEIASARAAQLADLDEARGAIDTERAEVRADRAVLVDGLPPDLVARYERSRAKHGGVGVAALRHGRCEGCRLSLTPVDLAKAKAAPEDALLSCEECGRLLVRVEQA